MNRVNISIILCTIVIVCGIWFFMASPGNTSTDFVQAVHSSPAQFDREVIETLSESAIFADTTSVLMPARIVLSNQSVYLDDFADFTIYEYDQQGNQKRKLTTTRGRGPGEVQHLTDFDVKGNTVWIADSENSRVTSYSLETGEYIDNGSVMYHPDTGTIYTSDMEKSLIYRISEQL